MATFTIRGKNIEVTPPLREYVEKKVGKMVKYFDRVGEISVLLTVIKGKHIVEVTMPIPDGVLLRGEESTGDMYSSIDLVVEKIERQIHKYKTKINRRLRGKGFRTEILAEEMRAREEAARKEAEEDFPVVKKKKFIVKPMDIQEAIMQMNLLNHDFFVFRDGTTEEVCVVYRRNDGKYGLIESGN